MFPFPSQQCANAVSTLDPSNKGANITLSNGNLTAAGGAGSFTCVKGSASRGAGKYHFEVHIDTKAGVNSPSVGVANAAASLSADAAKTTGIVYQPDGHVWCNNVDLAALSGYNTGDTISVEIDMDASNAYFRLNAGTRQGPYSFSGVAGAMFPVLVFNTATAQATVNLSGSTAFTVAPTAGFSAWG